MQQMASSHWHTIGLPASPFEDITRGAFLFKNLLPVTLGNVIGGTVLVRGMYWLVYLRRPVRMDS